MTIVRRIVFGAAFMLAPLSAVSAQTAPAYPTQTVTIVDPFTAGSDTDMLARVLAEKLGAIWSQTVIVENKPGIAGTIGVAKSAPDGYTLMPTSNGHTIVRRSINTCRSIRSQTSPASPQIASMPLVLTMTPALPANSLKELVAVAKEKPGALNFSSAGLASSTYIAGELFKQTAKIDIVHVPYRGTPEQFTSLMRGDSQLSMMFLGAALRFIQSGKIRALAIATPPRNPSLPDIPTFAEAGMPEYQDHSWFGIMAPARSPRRSSQKSATTSRLVLKLPDVAGAGKRSAQFRRHHARTIQRRHPVRRRSLRQAAKGGRGDAK